jgi:Lamin Tail Domain/Secretion system C-terminal sorting domain
LTGASGIFTLMDRRSAFIMDSVAEFRIIPPSISTPTHLPAVPRLNDSIWITTTINFNGTGTRYVYMGYRTATSQRFTKVLMYDDGLHRDGAANDGVWGAGIKATSALVEYYVYADNAQAGMFSPQRAEHDYHTIKAFFTVGDVVVNELMASNTKTMKDPNGQFDDWIELYNKSNATVNLSGWSISDDANKLNKWKFPQGTSIPANGYLIVWADEDSAQNTATSLHANFKLSGSGEAVLLTNNDSTLVDEITFGAQKADISFARRPNGTGNFVLQTTTYNANNNTGTTSTNEVFTENDLKIFPNPANTEGVTVRLNSDKNVDLQVFNTLGQAVFQGKIQGEMYLETQTWQRGMYFVKVGNVSKKLVVH